MPVDVSFGTETTPQQRAGSTTMNKRKTNGRGPKNPAQRRKNRKAPTHAQREHGAAFSSPGACQARIELKRTRKHEKAWGRLPREADQFDEMGARPENRYIIWTKEKVKEKKREPPAWVRLGLSWAQMSAAARRAKRNFDRATAMGKTDPGPGALTRTYPSGAPRKVQSWSISGDAVCASKNAARRRKSGETLQAYIEKSSKQRELDLYCIINGMGHSWEQKARLLDLLEATRNCGATPVPHTSEVEPGAWRLFAREHGIDGMCGLIETVSARADRKGDWAEALVRQMRHAWEWRNAARGTPVADSGPIGLLFALRDAPKETLASMGPGKRERARPWDEMETSRQQIAHIARIRGISDANALQIWAETRYHETSKIMEIARQRQRAYLPENVEYAVLNGRQIPQFPGTLNRERDAYVARDAHGRQVFRCADLKAFCKRIGADLSFRVGTIEKNPGPEDCPNMCRRCRKAGCDGRCEQRRAAKQAMARVEKEKKRVPGGPGSRKIKHINGCLCLSCRSKQSTRGAIPRSYPSPEATSEEDDGPTLEPMVPVSEYDVDWAMPTRSTTPTTEVSFDLRSVTSEEEAGPSCVRRGETADTKGKGRALPTACRYFPYCNRGTRCPYYHPSPEEARGAGPSNASNNERIEELEGLVNEMSDTIDMQMAHLEGQQRIMRELEERIKAGEATEALPCNCVEAGMPRPMNHLTDCPHHVEVDISHLSKIGKLALARIASQLGIAEHEAVRNVRALNAAIEDIREEEKESQRQLHLSEQRHYQLEQELAREQRKKDEEITRRLRATVLFQAREVRFAPEAAGFPDGSVVSTTATSMSSTNESKLKTTVEKIMGQVERNLRNASVAARVSTATIAAALAPLAALPFSGGAGQAAQGAATNLIRAAEIGLEHALLQIPQETATLSRALTAQHTGTLAVVTKYEVETLPGGVGKVFVGATRSFSATVHDAEALCQSKTRMFMLEGRLWCFEASAVSVFMSHIADLVLPAGTTFFDTEVPMLALKEVASTAYVLSAQGALEDAQEREKARQAHDAEVRKAEAESTARITAAELKVREVTEEFKAFLNRLARAQWYNRATDDIDTPALAGPSCDTWDAERNLAVLHASLEDARKAKTEIERLTTERGTLGKQFDELRAAVTHTRRRIRAHYQDGSHRHLLNGHYAWISSPGGSRNFFADTIGHGSWASRLMAQHDVGSSDVQGGHCVSQDFTNDTHAGSGWDWAGSFADGTDATSDAPSVSLDSEVVPKSTIRGVNAYVPDVVGQGRAAGSRIARDRFLAVLPMFAPPRTAAQKQAELDACLGYLLKKTSTWRPPSDDDPPPLRDETTTTMTTTICTSSPQGQYTKTELVAITCATSDLQDPIRRVRGPPVAEMHGDHASLSIQKTHETHDIEYPQSFFVLHGFFGCAVDSCPLPPRDVVEGVGLV